MIRPVNSFEMLEPRVLCYAGDILVSALGGDGSTHELRRYNPGGDLVGSIEIPGGGHDLQVDRFGQIQQWVGETLYRHVGPLDEAGEWVPQRNVAGWGAIGRTYYGGVATLGQYVFATDQATGSDTTRGLIRFDADNGYAPQRFATDQDFSDVTIGNDGLLYAMNGGGTFTPQVRAYDPVTLDLVRAINTPGFDNTAVAVDSQGNLYLGGSFDDKLWKLNPSGVALKSIDVTPTDIDVSADDQILMSGQGFVRLLNTELDELASFEAGSFSGTTFVAFAEHQHPLALTGTIIGKLFNDLDNDGIHDPGESVLRGRRVWVDLNSNGVHDAQDRSAPTNGAGLYRLGNMPAGTHVLRQKLPEGWSATKPFAKRTATLAGLQTLGGQNFGSWQNATITGFVFHDFNRNGVREDTEGPLAQWQLFLDLDADGVLDPGESSVRSNNRGQYTFADLTPGTYTIRITQQPGWFRTTKPAYELTLAPAEAAAPRLFGEKRIIS